VIVSRSLVFFYLLSPLAFNTFFAPLTSERFNSRRLCHSRASPGHNPRNSLPLDFELRYRH